MQNLHAEKEEAVKEHEKAVSDVEAHRSETRFRTTIWSLFLGALIAIAGVRALDSFMDPPKDVQVPKYLFIFLDVWRKPSRAQHSDMRSTPVSTNSAAVMTHLSCWAATFQRLADLSEPLWPSASLHGAVSCLSVYLHKWILIGEEA
jgi:hypothetical protein